MDAGELLEIISEAVTKPGIVKLARVVACDELLLHELIAFTFYPQKETAFRAAWILETIAEFHSQLFEPQIGYFLSRYPEQKNHSCRRHFTKIMMGLTGKERYQSGLVQTDMEPVIEATFEWLIEPVSPVAVQANCMDVLFNLKGRHHWIADELSAQIHFLMRGGGAAIQSRAKTILSKLK